jgi:hypothetical protein
MDEFERFVLGLLILDEFSCIRAMPHEQVWDANELQPSGLDNVEQMDGYKRLRREYSQRMNNSLRHMLIDLIFPFGH